MQLFRQYDVADAVLERALDGQRGMNFFQFKALLRRVISGSVAWEAVLLVCETIVCRVESGMRAHSSFSSDGEGETRDCGEMEWSYDIFKGRRKRWCISRSVGLL